jgi:flagellum-specific peptidoglycan hydrolase FlgJ
MLAQSYHENGGLSENGVASKTNNLFGIVCSGFSNSEVIGCYQVNSNYPTAGVVYQFRIYRNFSDSFRDWLDLMQDSGNVGYKNAINQKTVEEFAWAIAHSTYIPNDHNRPAYAAGVVNNWEKMKSTFGFISGATIAILLLVVLLISYGGYRLYIYLKKRYKLPISGPKLSTVNP